MQSLILSGSTGNSLQNKSIPLNHDRNEQPEVRNKLFSSARCFGSFVYLHIRSL
jgi:hypothetical protein